MRLKLLNKSVFRTLKDISEKSICKLNLSGVRVSLAAYFLAFGLYGYGSDIQVLQPLSFLPLSSGLLVSLFFITRPSGYFEKWTYLIDLRLKHISAFFSVLALLFLATSKSLGDELVGDELSYLQLSVAHSLKISELLPFLDQSSAIGPMLQVLSIFLIAGFLAPALLFIALAPLRMTIAAVAVSVSAFQIAFSFFGGWGWGYAKVAWLPYLLPISLFGPDAIVFRITSLMIVALGFTFLFFTLRTLNLSAIIRATVVLLLITLPVPALFYSSLDHVVFFVAIAIPSVVFLLKRPSDRGFDLIFLVLSVAVLFRISISFLLLALVFWVLGDKPYAKNFSKLWRTAQPSLLVLIPYGSGVAFATPVLSNGGSPTRGIELQPNELIGIFVEQLGAAESIFTLGMLAAAVVFSSRRSPLVFFMVLLGSFYLFILQPSGLVGVAKYSVEWALPLFLLALARLGMGVPKLNGKPIHKIATACAFSLVAAVIFLSSHSSFEANFSSSPKSTVTELKTYTPLDYEKAQDFLVESRITECAPVGVVYGAGNEILANRALGVVKFARAAHAELQAAQVAKTADWTILSAEVASSSRFKCMYGASYAFQDLESEDWDEWTVTFDVSGLPGVPNTLVLQR